MKLFYVPDINSVPQLSEEESGHAVRVLRLREGDEIMVVDGQGEFYRCATKLISLTDAMPEAKYVPCGDENGVVSQEEIDSAVRAARESRVAVLAIGLPENYESEAFDREHMRLPEDYNSLVSAVSEVNKNTVVLLFGGGAMELPWVDKVAAILYMGLGGQAVGEAVASIVTGKVNPSGKLTESWPEKYSDTVSSDTFGNKNAEYREGIYVGYRYYDKSGVEPRYPFGYGLSYTEFEYSDLSISGNKLTFSVKNVGRVKGSEVAQIYVSAPHQGLYRAPKELCGFKKLTLDTGESQKVEIAIDDRSLAFWNDGFKTQSGEYTLLVGASSQDIRLEGKIDIVGEDIEPFCPSKWYATPCGKTTREEWEILLGRSVESDEKHKKCDFSLSSTISEMRESSLLMKLAAKIIERVLLMKFKTKSSTTYKMMLASVLECPIRSMEICGGGAMNDALAKLIVLLAKFL